MDWGLIRRWWWGRYYHALWATLWRVRLTSTPGLWTARRTSTWATWAAWTARATWRGRMLALRRPLAVLITVLLRTGLLWLLIELLVSHVPALWLIIPWCASLALVSALRSMLILRHSIGPHGTRSILGIEKTEGYICHWSRLSLQDDVNTLEPLLPLVRPRPHDLLFALQEGDGPLKIGIVLPEESVLIFNELVDDAASSVRLYVHEFTLDARLPSAELDHVFLEFP